jgi:hypothetical protein
VTGQRIPGLGKDVQRRRHVAYVRAVYDAKSIIIEPAEPHGFTSLDAERRVYLPDAGPFNSDISR